MPSCPALCPPFMTGVLLQRSPTLCPLRALRPGPLQHCEFDGDSAVAPHARRGRTGPLPARGSAWHGRSLGGEVPCATGRRCDSLAEEGGEWRSSGCHRTRTQTHGLLEDVGSISGCLIDRCFMNRSLESRAPTFVPPKRDCRFDALPLPYHLWDSFGGFGQGVVLDNPRYL